MWALKERVTIGMQILSVSVDRDCLELCVQKDFEAEFRPSRKDCAEGVQWERRGAAQVPGTDHP